jgi:rare lipoprotein A
MIKTTKHQLNFLILIPLLLMGSACSFTGPKDGAPRRHVNVDNIPDATPKVEPITAAGNPSRYTVLGKTYSVMDDANGYVERGLASWYGTKFHGRKTSNGETYSMYAMTAAHKSLPIPTYVQVINLKNGREVIVRVNDRGPFHANRIIDLSYVAAKKLGIVGHGTGFVEVRSIDPRTWNKREAKGKPDTNTQPVKLSSSDSLFIQAGAFTSRHNANQLQQNLHALFPNRTVSLAYNEADNLYRVRIGPLNTVDEADQIAQTISDHGFPNPHVVID